MSADPTEVEAKFAVGNRAAILAVIERGAPAELAGFEPAGPSELREVVDRYVDTQGEPGALSTFGYRARLRTEHRQTTLTIKGEAHRDGVITERLELEGPATLRLDPSSWPPSVARDRLLSLLAAAAGAGTGAGPTTDPARGPGTSDGRLRVVASLRQHRHVRRFRRSGTIVEISLDELEAPAGRSSAEGAPWGATGLPARRHRIELEIELKAGDRSDLADLVAALSATRGLRPALGSKRDFAIGAANRPDGGPEPPGPRDGFTSC